MSAQTGVLWQCPCGAYNQMGRHVCSGCAKQFTAGLVVSATVAWPVHEQVSALHPAPSSDSRPARRVLSLTSAHFSHGTAVIAGRAACSKNSVSGGVGASNARPLCHSPGRSPDADPQSLTGTFCWYCGRGSSCDCDRFRDGRV